MIDEQGYRLNIGIIIANHHGQLLWAKRVVNTDAWQFPQGGIHNGETPEQAMYRELTEELGLTAEDVDIIAESKNWYRYELPEQFRRHTSKPLCIGQKQKWFLLRLKTNENKIHFNHSATPEFSEWCWVNYWHPVNHVIAFKRDVYQAILTEFADAVKT